MTHCLLRRPNLSSSPRFTSPFLKQKKLQKIESFYLGNTLGNYKSNLNKINEVTIISILRFTWNSSLLSFFNSTRIILRHVAKSHFFTFFKGLQKCSALCSRILHGGNTFREITTGIFIRKKHTFLQGYFPTIYAKRHSCLCPSLSLFRIKRFVDKEPSPSPRLLTWRGTPSCVCVGREWKTLESFSDKLIFHLNVK